MVVGLQAVDQGERSHLSPLLSRALIHLVVDALTIEKNQAHTVVDECDHPQAVLALEAPQGAIRKGLRGPFNPCDDEEIRKRGGQGLDEEESDGLIEEDTFCDVMRRPEEGDVECQK